MASRLLQIIRLSVVKKQIGAVTGLLLALFVVSHLAGNFLIFRGPEAFNAYAEKIQSLGPLLWFFRIGLATAAIVHVVSQAWVTVENWSARGGSRYAVSPGWQEATWASRSMIYTGILIFAFVWLHLADFTFPQKPEEGGIYLLLWESFQRPWRVAVYLVAMAALGLHLGHALASVFQTFGFLERYAPMIQRSSYVIGALIALGFMSIPLYVNLAGKMPTAG